jgi:hypothetical protein
VGKTTIAFLLRVDPSKVSASRIATMVDREAGANSLRGGRNIYTSKCKVGNWVEEEYHPDISRTGFSKASRVHSGHEGTSLKLCVSRQSESGCGAEGVGSTISFFVARRPDTFRIANQRSPAPHISRRCPYK